MRRGTFLPLQDADPTPSFGGFGVSLAADCMGWRGHVLLSCVTYVMADDFCKCRSQPQRTPSPKVSLTRGEVVTVVIFSQWARFRSERDFYRYAASRLRPAFPTLPRRSQFNRLTRRHYGTLAAFSRHLVDLLQG